MKIKHFFISIIVASFIVSCGNGKGTKNNNDSTANNLGGNSNNLALKGSISVSGAFALYPLMVKWAKEFQILHPEVSIDVSAGGAGKGVTDALGGMVNIGMISREISQEEINKGAWVVAVAKDAVVPIICKDNPYIQTVVNYGLKKEIFQDIFVTGKLKKWGDVTGRTTDKDAIKVFTRSDACGAAETWAKFLNKKQEDLKGTGVFGDPGIVEAIQKEKFGIAYSNIAFVFNAQTKLKNDNIYIVPIDINGNGIVDDNEQFYDDLNGMTKAIETGKYPSPPARDLFLVCKGKPNDNITKAFIEFILTHGQQFINDAGYVKLPNDKITKGLESLK